MKIKTATSEDLDILTLLFDRYRVFYKQESNLSAAREFLKDRLRKKDSVIFLAVDENGAGLGFAQLYPSFSSVAMQRVYILNDLFVSKEARGKGIGEELLEHSKNFAKANESRGLTLETAVDNPAQNLYERLGWVKDTKVFHYTWETDKSI
ncbi:MAG: GNAT family N-acetyltransferase [Bacteroidia bacterium]|nr:GNAT family N-acetyltransferase [Bacteroidia bacterium]NNF30250.1 GNAT family N-acetyltransferase [Flavobacteriaceae bacterium]MBT8277321.1 GNAT family N-acetyltransferase [Bacteroidia bacterium]NNJ81634.1 GNAT family N-acetyltransferase [Flavobacteriaceae bacterium]NNK54257.1 GNAT family N-acetyltransferase [Flavobacteriaceae bacterium]